MAGREAAGELPPVNDAAGQRRRPVFQPEQLTINAGDKVRFEVRGLGPHNLIVAGHPEWSHEPLSFAVGESWEQQFDMPGRNAIWCEPHRAAGMTAEINVLAPG